ncbi:hypothetical protein OU798_15350 [Prolixibacteraceae bacterium Z1-6]|uniref:DUF4251 domain-containing protein n=1 Tax=Draconibacterium aestuarii TaxID=2998507 RepID=A0A9X3F706_9BACT|nr:hypothetical protein [Prolixibacteraceae bacterium Z1-6]
MMNLFVLLFYSLFSLFAGKSAANANVYIEKGAHREVVAFKKTGIKGQVVFRHLDAATYRVLIVFPQQAGKLMEQKSKHQTMTKASYNQKNKTYYYQGEEGYFAIKFSDITRIKNENFLATFKEDHDEEGNFAVIAEFGAHKNGASISLSVKAITAAQFKKATNKIGHDISTQSIQGIK